MPTPRVVQAGALVLPTAFGLALGVAAGTAGLPTAPGVAVGGGLGLLGGLAALRAAGRSLGRFELPYSEEFEAFGGRDLPLVGPSEFWTSARGRPVTVEHDADGLLSSFVRVTTEVDTHLEDVVVWGPDADRTGRVGPGDATPGGAGGRSDRTATDRPGSPGGGPPGTVGEASADPSAGEASTDLPGGEASGGPGDPTAATPGEGAFVVDSVTVEGFTVEGVDEPTARSVLPAEVRTALSATAPVGVVRVTEGRVVRTMPGFGFESVEAYRRRCLSVAAVAEAVEGAAGDRGAGRSGAGTDAETDVESTDPE